MGLFDSAAALLARAGWAWRAGMSFGGARDLYKVFGYKTVLTHTDFVAKYLRQDIAQRVINAPVDAIWTDPPLITDGSRFTSAWKTFTEEDFPLVWANLRKADIFAGLGAFSILVVGFDDGAALDRPVNSGRKNKVIYMQPYLEASVRITKLEEDSSDPRFGKPVLYEVTPGELFSVRTMSNPSILLREKFTVHWTRVLHLAEGTLENNIFGHSRLEPVYNLLDDMLKVGGGSAETYWLTANRGMQVDVDKEMELDESDADDLAAEIDEYQHQLRRVIRTRGVKITNLGSDIADPKSEFNVLLALLSAATGIPQRILMGAEAGQLASQQDRANWAGRIDERTKNYAEPYIIRPFVDLLVSANVLPKPGVLQVKWPESFKMNPLERAQTSAQMARSAVNMARALEVAQKCMIDLLSVEESREIIAPGSKMPIFTGVPTGTLPPSIKEVDPQKFILDDPSADGDGADGSTRRGGSSSGASQDGTFADPDSKRPEETRGDLGEGDET